MPLQNVGGNLGPALQMGRAYELQHTRLDSLRRMIHRNVYIAAFGASDIPDCTRTGDQRLRAS